MNRRDIVDAFDALKDNPAGFMLWMAGYLAAGNTYPEEKDDDGWIKHDGGPCPVRGDVKVSVKFRRGESADDSRCAGYWFWGHNNADYDIIAYRIVDE